jgi:hypothetical protein
MFGGMPSYPHRCTMRDVSWASHVAIAFMMAACVAASVEGGGLVNSSPPDTNDNEVSEASRRSTLLFLPLFSVNTWPNLPWNYLYTPWWLQWKSNLLLATTGGSTSYGCFKRLNDNFRPSMIRQLLQERASYGSSGTQQPRGKSCCHAVAVLARGVLRTGLLGQVPAAVDNHCAFMH